MKIPLSDELFKHSQFVDFVQKGACGFDDVEYFITKYSWHLHFFTVRRLHEEFVEYQMMKKTDIPERIWEKARVKEFTEEDVGMVRKIKKGRFLQSEYDLGISINVQIHVQTKI